MSLRVRTAALAAALLTGCGGICGDEGCTQGVNVNATAPAELAPGATYRVEIEGDGETRACELTIGEDDLCKSGGVLLVVPNGNQLGISVSTTPARLAVSVLQDGTVIGSAAYDVEYTREHVDNGGADCDMDCNNGGVKDLALSPTL